MNHDLKVFLIVGACVIGLAGIAIFGYAFFAYSHVSQTFAGLDDRAEEGATFGRDVDQNACVDEAIRRYAPEASLAGMSAHAFVRACLSKAKPVGGLCSGLPAPDDIPAGAAWVRNRCSALGSIDSAACQTVMRGVKAYCEDEAE